MCFFPFCDCPRPLPQHQFQHIKGLQPLLHLLFLTLCHQTDQPWYPHRLLCLHQKYPMYLEMCIRYTSIVQCVAFKLQWKYKHTYWCDLQVPKCDADSWRARWTWHQRLLQITNLCSCFCWSLDRAAAVSYQRCLLALLWRVDWMLLLWDSSGCLMNSNVVPWLASHGYTLMSSVHPVTVTEAHTTGAGEAESSSACSGSTSWDDCFTPQGTRWSHSQSLIL